MPQGIAEVCNALLSKMQIQPVLVDIGASGGPPNIWRSIGRKAVYVGFDPDLRETREIADGQFARTVMVNKAVTSKADAEEIDFYLTRSPYCSSTLPPDHESLSQYLFADLFQVQQHIRIRAGTVSSALERLSLDRLDWFKTDSQGTDLRIFLSLRRDVRSKVLAVDMEPGLIDAYTGEDLFVEVHARMPKEGFWLSRLDAQGTVRMRPETCALNGMSSAEVLSAVRPSPGWTEIRYLRTLESMSTRPAQDYALLWMFSMLDEQFGFALDIADEYGRLFGKDETYKRLADVARRAIRRAGGSSVHSAWKKARRLLSRLKG